MDLLSISKDKWVAAFSFLRKQLMVWVSVMRYPLGVVSKVNLRSNEAVTPAISFIVFVYALTLLVAIPNMVLYQNMAVSSWVVILTDFVLTGLSFCMMGLTLYAAGKLMGGRGGLLASMIAGFYLTALWPIIQFTDYFLSPELPEALAEWTAILRFALFMIILVFVVVLIVVWASPVMGHVHAIGRVRATIATLIQGFLMFACLLFLRQYFEKLAGKH